MSGRFPPEGVPLCVTPPWTAWYSPFCEGFVHLVMNWEPSRTKEAGMSMISLTFSDIVCECLVKYR